MNLAGLAAILAYSQFIQSWRNSGHYLVAGFQILIVFGTALGVVGLGCIGKAPEPRMSEGLSASIRRLAVTLPFRERPFRRFMAFYCCWTFFAAIGGMFFHMYMLEYLQLRHQRFGYILVAVTDMITMVLSIAMAPVWGRLADRWGTQRMLLLTGTVMAIFPLLWIPITPQWWWLIFLVVLVRAFASGTEIGPITMAMQMAPRRRRSVYISVYRSLGCVTMAVAPIVGGAIAYRAGPSMFVIGTFAFGGLHLLFAVSSAGRIVSLLLLRRLA
jgi:MFS family permease